MPGSEKSEIFGTGDASNIDVELPLRFADGALFSITPTLPIKTLIRIDGIRCVIAVKMSGSPILANWYDIWAAATAIAAICARFGKDGYSTGTGMTSYIFSLVEESRLINGVSWR